MAGHSHWSSIKHKKKKEDKKRGKLFSKLSKQIISAVREGGEDPQHNVKLQQAIDEAKENDMPKDNIERAILKGAGKLPGQEPEPARYEGYSKGGAAVMVDALTDNRNRTNSEIKNIFQEHGGKVGTNGCVSWMFETLGFFLLKADGMTDEQIFDIAVEAGADDFERAGDFYELTCDVEDFNEVKNALDGNGIGYETAEITRVPQSYVDLDVEAGRRAVELTEELEDHQDVEDVYSNFNLPQELADELSNQG